MPSLATTPEELTASNLALNTISGVGMFAGPAIAGVVLAFSGPTLVFALTAAAYVWSGFFVFGLRPDAPPEATGDSAIVPQLLAGFRAIGADRRLQVVIGLVGAQMFVLGALEVVIVVDAIRVLHAGNAGVGWLNTGARRRRPARRAPGRRARRTQAAGRRLPARARRLRRRRSPSWPRRRTSRSRSCSSA